MHVATCCTRNHCLASALLPHLMPVCLLSHACAALQLPAWPFVCASVFLGAYALIPYMALWEPKSPQQQLPPPEEELVRQQEASSASAAEGLISFVC